MELHCHCGNIHVSVPEKPETLTSCNCSMCNRYGALWGYYLPGEVEVSVKHDQPGAYCWGDECINFHFCPSCGCVTHYTSTGKVEMNKVAVNFRMADLKQMESIPIRRFDGADSWTFID